MEQVSEGRTCRDRGMELTDDRLVMTSSMQPRRSAQEALCKLRTMINKKSPIGFPSAATRIVGFTQVMWHGTWLFTDVYRRIVHHEWCEFDKQMEEWWFDLPSLFPLANTDLSWGE